MFAPTFHSVSVLLCMLQAFGFVVKCKELLGSRNSVERVITDLNVIYSPNGVPLDYSYNQSHNNNNEQISSAPGCPKSIDGYPWVHALSSPHSGKSTMRCYLVGSQGPCSKAQVLYILSARSNSGVCACECLLNYVEGDWDWKPSPDKRTGICVSGNIQQIFDKQDKTACYNVFEQGPCPIGKVVSFFATASSHNLTNAAGFPVPCLPPCDGKDTDQFNVNCVLQYATPSHAGVTFLEPNSCPDDEKYSDLLKKCIKRHKTKLVLG